MRGVTSCVENIENAHILKFDTNRSRTFKRASSAKMWRIPQSSWSEQTLENGDVCLERRVLSTDTRAHVML